MVCEYRVTKAHQMEQATANLAASVADALERAIVAAAWDIDFSLHYLSIHTPVAVHCHEAESWDHLVEHSSHAALS